MCMCRHWKRRTEIKKGSDLYEETKKENLKNNNELEDRDGGREKGARELDRGETGKTGEPAGRGGGERNKPTGSRTETAGTGSRTVGQAEETRAGSRRGGERRIGAEEEEKGRRKDGGQRGEREGQGAGSRL